MDAGNNIDIIDFNEIPCRSCRSENIRMVINLTTSETKTEVGISNGTVPCFSLVK
jgi:hypothetical protein